jgi:hypothetical protein
MDLLLYKQTYWLEWKWRDGFSFKPESLIIYISRSTSFIIKGTNSSSTVL